MKLAIHTSSSGVDNHDTSLRHLINTVVSDSATPVSLHKSVIANKVPADIQMSDKEKMMPVISDLLTIVISNARNGNIHISAERISDMIILEIQERNNYNGYALAYSIQSMESQAALLGGYINMKGQQQLVTTISFSFPNGK